MKNSKRNDKLKKVSSAYDLMPKDEGILKILHERAEILSAKESKDVDAKNEQYLKFSLNSEHYAVPYEYLDEILYARNIAPVPCTPGFIAGVINRRGELLTVVNLKQLIRSANHEANLANELGERIIVVQNHDECMGLLVDSIEGNETYVSSNISPPLLSNNISNIEYIQGICDEKVALLNVKAIFSDKNLVVDEAAE